MIVEETLLEHGIVPQSSSKLKYAAAAQEYRVPQCSADSAETTIFGGITTLECEAVQTSLL